MDWRGFTLVLDLVEGDGVHRPGVEEEHCHKAGVNDGVAGGPVQPGVDPRVLLDEQPITEQSPLPEQVVDNTRRC